MDTYRITLTVTLHLLRIKVYINKQYLNLNMASIIFIWITTVHNNALVHCTTEVIA